MANATFLNAVNGQNPFKIPRAVEWTDGVVSTTMDGAATFTKRTPARLRLDPDGSDRTITMYSAVGHNREHFMFNAGASGEDITITGVQTLNAGEWVYFASDGAAWVVLAGSVGGTTQYDDDIAVWWGAAPDANITWVSASDDWVFDNVSVTGSTIMRLGTDTSATDFQWHNNGGGVLMDIDGAGTIAIDALLALTVESAGGAISVGADAVAQAVNIATGAAARVITIGNAASASMALDAGVGAFSLLADTTVDIDGAGAVSIESSGAAINVGADAIAQAVNVATGAAARVITIGNAASASLAVDSGVGAWTVQGDTTGGLTSGTLMTLTSVAGGIVLDSQGATEAIYNTLGTDTSATEWAVRNNSETRILLVKGDSTIVAEGRVTTTDGVSGGTARVVGGVAYRGVAASSAVTNTTTETLFDISYTTPANTLKAGSVVTIKWQGIATATNATDTLAIVLYIGGLAGTALTTLAATDVANSDIFSGEMELTIRTAGTGGTFVASGWSSDFTSASSEAVVREWVASTVVDTTAAQVIGVGAKWGAAATGNSCRLDYLTVTIA